MKRYSEQKLEVICLLKEYTSKRVPLNIEERICLYIRIIPYYLLFTYMILMLVDSY